MTRDRFRECLDALGISQRGMAVWLQRDERQVRRWAAGAVIPDDVAVWIEKLAVFHEKNPPPIRSHRGE